jgi:hypothetical protein
VPDEEKGVSLFALAEEHLVFVEMDVGGAACDKLDVLGREPGEKGRVTEE